MYKMYHLRITFLAFFFFYIAVLSAQNLGYTPFYKKEHTHITQVNYEGEKKYILFSGLASEQFKDGVPTLCEISNKNEINNCKKLRPEYGYSDMVYLNGQFLMIGIAIENGVVEDSLILEVRDSSFDLIMTKSFDASKFFNSYCLLINDSIHIFTQAVSLSTDDFREFVVPKSFDLDSVTIHKYDIDGNYVSNVIEEANGVGYVSYMFSGIYHVDNHFNILNKADSLINLHTGNVINSLDSGYVCFGGAIDRIGKSNTALGITKLDKDLHFVKGDIFGNGPDSYDYAGLQNPIATDSLNYYVTGMIGIQEDNLILGKKSTYFYVAKYDKAINRLWLKKLGGERHYVINGVYATGDGGCCIYGFVRDFVNDFVTTPFIMCFDEQGETSSYSVQYSPQEKLFELKGNLIQYNITITNKNNASGYGYELYDATGRRMLKGSLGLNESLIDSSGLPSGFYFMVVKDSQQDMILTEKLIKY